VELAILATLILRIIHLRTSNRRGGTQQPVVP
jgi:hypothetical protein